jgi:hypothetical protein
MWTVLKDFSPAVSRSGASRATVIAATHSAKESEHEMEAKARRQHCGDKSEYE